MILALLAAAAINLPAPVRGDFDHDGKPDVAEVVAAPGGKFNLVVRRGAGPVEVVDTFDVKAVANLYVTKAKPGRYQTWCGKGGGADKDPCPRRSVVLSGDTLDYGAEEASELVAVWTGKRFEVVPLSD